VAAKRIAEQLEDRAHEPSGEVGDAQGDLIADQYA
jgi:hypothetical protein